MTLLKTKRMDEEVSFVATPTLLKNKSISPTLAEAKK